MPGPRQTNETRAKPNQSHSNQYPGKYHHMFARQPPPVTLFAQKRPQKRGGNKTKIHANPKAHKRTRASIHSCAFPRPPSLHGKAFQTLRTPPRVAETRSSPPPPTYRKVCQASRTPQRVAEQPPPPRTRFPRHTPQPSRGSLSRASP